MSRWPTDGVCAMGFCPCSRNLGGKLGVSIKETLGVENMGELTQFSKAQLGQHFGDKTG